MGDKEKGRGREKGGREKGGREKEGKEERVGGDRGVAKEVKFVRKRKGENMWSNFPSLICSHSSLVCFFSFFSPFFSPFSYLFYLSVFLFFSFLFFSFLFFILWRNQISLILVFTTSYDHYPLKQYFQKQAMTHVSIVTGASRGM